MKTKNELVCISDTSMANIDELPYLFVSEFNDDSVRHFYKDFIKLHSDPKVDVIPIVVSSYGGQVHALLSMLDIIQSATKPVATISLGKAMSCGAILLAAGTKGYRYAAPNTDIMIHEVASMEMGKNTDIQNGSKQTKRLNTLLFKYLGDFSNKNKRYFLSELKKRGNIDWHLSANDFKDLGLVDHVCVPQLIKN